MQTIKLSDASARKMYPNATPEIKQLLEDSFTKEFFKQNIMDRIQSYEDACADQGLDPIDELPFVTPKNAKQEAANAFIMLDTISKSLLEGVILDWSNSDQRKHYPVFNNYNSGSGFRFVCSPYDWTVTFAIGGARLCVDTEEKSDYFGTQFLSIWNKFLNPNK